MHNYNGLEDVRNLGFIVNDLIHDGNVHRIPTQTKPRSKNGWYVAFPNSPVIVVGDWATGERHIITPENYKYTKQQQVELNKAMAASHKTKRLEQKTAAKIAQERYLNAKAVRHHPYLKKKGILAPDVLRVEKCLLLVPLFDITVQSPQVVNLQTIDPQGNKFFLKGARVKGLCCPIGESVWEEQTTLYIAEGFATAMSIHMDTAAPALVAFNAGNLINVAKLARRRWPARKLVIAGDDDWLTAQKTGTNPGREKATKAALLIEAKLSFPDFTEQQKGHGLTDWNDYLTLKDETVTNENET